MHQSFFNNAVCDKAIISITEGDINALSVIYDLMSRQIYSLAMSILRNIHDAEDVLQDTLYEIVKCSHAYRKGSNAKAWVLSITRNLALKKVRNRKITVPLDEAENTLNASVSDDTFIKPLLFFDTLKILPDDEQQIIVLKIHSGLKHKEIADVMEMSVTAVQKKYQRACKKLSAYFK
ncbi:MAG: hypothetical protein A2Y17_10215 [Clostridiales bacterium GWF2_38_85]|nr:MAG: hypothetical protein A2Y17_10215 [Clostridiales bacterium GWF2_38_85]HBL83299.1 RNA polymerase sigma factor [Clostridiales bacterium]